MTKIAVIQFPGSNCEYETAKAVSFSGASADVLRWNSDATTLSSYDGFVLPGGFSYQDRVRAGVMAAKLPVMDVIEKASLDGKPVLGICNGCQILAETGLVPNTKGDATLEMALTPNRKGDVAKGFVCDWVYVKVKNASASVFTQGLSENEVLPIPINHGEGRFILSESALEQVASHTQFVYCTADGQVIDTPAVNPNGTTANIAGLTNKNGTVLAIMPHPERAAFLKQLPTWLESEWGEKKRQRLAELSGPWSRLFALFNYEGVPA